MSSLEQTPVIEVAGLTARFGDNTILENLTFQVAKGEILVILGGSGCGKSTLLKHMIGLYRPYRGKVLINGVNVNTGDEKKLAKLRQGMGVLFQSGALFGSMTLAENVALPLTEYTNLSEDAIDLIVKMKLGPVDLAGYENHLPEEVSGGMKKRAGLARAMSRAMERLIPADRGGGLSGDAKEGCV